MSLFDDFPRGAPGQSNRGALLGTASWSASAQLWKPGMIFLGLDDGENKVGYIDDRHIVTVAGSRGGKGVSAILPNLRRWPGSCTVLDPKGENATTTAALRAAMPGHKVAVVDPHGVAKVSDDLRASFNPLDLIDAEADDAIDIAAAIGDALMIDSGDGKDIHWTESARQIVEALILYVAATEVGPARSLVRVRQLLTKRRAGTCGLSQ
jgi:type IV secretion system protein VirD4